MNQFPSQNYSGPAKQSDPNQNAPKLSLPYIPSNFGSLTNTLFPPILTNLASNPLVNTFASAGLSGEHMGYPYMQVIFLY